MTSSHALDLIKFPTSSDFSDELDSPNEVKSILSMMSGLDNYKIKIDAPKSSMNIIKSAKNDEGRALTYSLL